ncbi:MAG: hypothetical protein ACYCSA_05740 [Thermoplasmataceae archaeon]
MFLRLAKRKHKHGVGRYAQIAEKYREGGKQKTRVIMHLGPVNNEADMERYISIFNQELQKTNITGTEMDKLIFDPPLDFGMICSKKYHGEYWHHAFIIHAWKVQGDSFSHDSEQDSSSRF